MTVKSFYNYAPVLSFNARYNFIVGGRGKGKTYGAQKKVIRDAIKTHIKNPGMCDQFIYLRRYKDELRMARDTFFAAVEHEFPDWDFRINGYEAQMSHVSTREEKKRQWHVIGFFISLSVAQSYKSVAFPRVKIIIFDEFIIEKSAIHYLPNEATIFNNFFSTVDRYKDKTRVFFLANSVSITNPYFLEFKIDPDKQDDKGFIKLYGGFVIVHFIPDGAFETEVYQTEFGQFIAGTAYADYAVGNKFADNHKNLIELKPDTARHMMSLETYASTFSVWYDLRSSKYFCQQKLPKEDHLYTIVTDRMDDNKTLLRTNDKSLQSLRTAYNHARVRFDAPLTRNAFIEIFKQ